MAAFALQLPGPTREQTAIKDIRLEPSATTIRLGESLDATLRFKLTGELRAAFNLKTWEDAYKADDKTLKLQYRMRLLRSGFLRRTALAQPAEVSRRATLYWSRSPNLPYRIWMMIVDENGGAIIPQTLDEVPKLLFDLEHKFSILSLKVGKGSHTFLAKIEARWGPHTYVKNGVARAVSPSIHVNCV